jgi:hypothetical protein
MANVPPLLGRPLDFTRESLERLKTAQFAENSSLDYKQAAPQEDLREFAKDVTALANTNGGWILYGVEEDRATSAPKDFPGFDAPNPELVVRQLSDYLRGNVAPRLQDPEYGWINLFSGKKVLVVRVFRSWAGPHAARQALPFYKRGANSSPPMDVYELRRAFLSGEQAGERFRRFCSERLRVVGWNDPHTPPVPLAEGLRSVVHVAPAEALHGIVALSVPEHHTALRVLRPALAYDGAHIDHRPNIDGHVSCWEAGRDQALGYVQVFRSGYWESVSVFADRATANQVPFVNAGEMESGVLTDVTNAVKFFEKCAISFPLYARHSLIGGSRFTLQPGGYQSMVHTSGRVVGRDEVSFPEALIEEPSANLPSLLRPSFDALWNVFGFAKSQNFSEDGRWTDPRRRRQDSDRSI